MKRSGRIKLVAVAALGILAFAGTPAVAAGNHAISGTVYDPCSGKGPWFESQTARVKSGKGAVKAEFSSINPGGLNWKLLGKSNQQFGNTQQWGPNETGIWRTFTSSMASGTNFFNTFEELDGACNHGNYNFAGTENY